MFYNLNFYNHEELKTKISRHLGKVSQPHS